MTPDERDDARGTLQGLLVLAAYLAALCVVGSCERASAASQRVQEGTPATPAVCARVYDAAMREVTSAEDALVLGYEARDAGDSRGWLRWIGTAEARLERADKLRKMHADCVRSLPIENPAPKVA